MAWFIDSLGVCVIVHLKYHECMCIIQGVTFTVRLRCRCVPFKLLGGEWGVIGDS